MKSPILVAVCCLVASTLLAQTGADNPPPLFPPATALRPETVARLGRMTPIFDGQTLTGWKASVKGTKPVDVTTAWTVKDGVLASLGVGRGVLHTEQAYGYYRIVFQVRHVSGNPDHQACVLFFCSEPVDGVALDALGAIQYQPPNSGGWDYRPGKNNNGKGLFTRLPHPRFDPHEWSQIEILVNAEAGTARMAVAQPIGTRAYEVLAFKDVTAGKVGPFGLQMHNKGLFDEFRDIRIEVDPKDDRLLTVETPH